MTQRSMVQRNALIAGATGLIGQKLVQYATDSGLYNRIYLLSRRETGLANGLVQDLIIDFEELAEDLLSPGKVTLDDAFIALGTTRKDAGSMAAFRRVDHDYILATARFAKMAGASRLALVSSVGANARSSSGYLACKGQVEEEIGRMEFAQTVIMRPGLLTGGHRNGRKRIGESIGEQMAPFISPFLQGNLRQYRAIDHTAVAAAMPEALRDRDDGLRALTHDRIITLAKQAGWRPD